MPASNPTETYICTRVHGQAVPFMACIANPIAITSAIWAWNYTRKNRYERIVNSSMKVFDPSFSFNRLFVQVSILRPIRSTRAICYFIWCVYVIYDSVICIVSRPKNNYLTNLFRWDVLKLWFFFSLIRRK